MKDRKKYERALCLSYIIGIPVASDANAERRKYLEDQEALFQAERQAAQVKAREEVEARVRVL